MRSRAFTAGCPAAAAALKYARHVRLPAPARRCERLTVLIGAGESTEIRPVARSGARDEKTHLILLRRDARDATAANTAIPIAPEIKFVIEKPLLFESTHSWMGTLEMESSYLRINFR
jgi:hypothetical protein